MKAQLDPTIVTARLALHQPRDGDIDDIVAGIGDPAVTRMLGRVPLPYRRADAEAFLHVARRDARSGKNLNLSIFHDGRLIGGIGISNLPGYNELGYWLARGAWGKGYATEAGHAVLAYGFDVLGLKRCAPPSTRRIGRRYASSKSSASPPSGGRCTIRWRAGTPSRV